jgi:hypothetical protein
MGRRSTQKSTTETQAISSSSSSSRRSANATRQNRRQRNVEEQLQAQVQDSSTQRTRRKRGPASRAGPTHSERPPRRQRVEDEAPSSFASIEGDQKMSDELGETQTDGAPGGAPNASPNLLNVRPSTVAPSNARRRNNAVLGSVPAFTPDEEREIVACIMEKMTSLNLRYGTTADPEGGISWTRLRNGNTQETYNKHYRGLLYFFNLLGDWESMMCLLDNPPAGCPSMRVRSIVLYFEWRRRSGTLMDQNGQEVRDRFGNPISCISTWVAPGNVHQCRSAISDIHEKIGQRGTYRESCEQCILNYRVNGSQQPCPVHLGGFPLLRRTGNPRESNSLNNYMDMLADETADYVPYGSEPLDPWELLRVRNALIATNNLWDLQFACMLLVGCALFLREDELSNIRVSDLDFELTSVNTAIDSVAVKIQGKRDVSQVTLILWANHAVPNLCPVRHLLLYLHKSGIKGGFLFPPEVVTASLNGNPVDIDENVSYVTALERFQTLFSQQTGRPQSCFGTHSIRKTSFVLAFWGGADGTDVRGAARLKSFEMVARYKRECNHRNLQKSK